MNSTSSLKRLAALALAVSFRVSTWAATDPATEGVAFFEKRIRPVLAQKCYQCHSAEAEKVKGSLLLDTRDGIRAGGDSGHAIVPGNVKASLLLKAIRYDDNALQMPPAKAGGKLPDNVIADFETWVQMGAPDPRNQKSEARDQTRSATGHWAFRLPKKAAPPAVKNTTWIRNDIDRFILSELEAKQLEPVAEAEERTLIRRLYFDLIGLPPSPEQVRAFLQSAVRNPQSAIKAVVDKLLASPQFGERWGRHWLDVARYAESSGKELNIVYPHAWRYRDYVINSFNQDKPYDRFLIEQLAGDLLPASHDTQRAEQIIATGYLAIGPKSHNTRNQRQFQVDLADEQIDALSQGMLGLTVACARCHDHKFDPIPTTDYYAMAGIFLSTETCYGTPRLPQNRQGSALITLPENAQLTDAPPPPAPQLAMMKRRLERAKKEREDVLSGAGAKRERGPVAVNPRLLRATAEIGVLEQQLSRYGAHGKPERLAMGAQDKPSPRDARVLARGELDKPGETVRRGFVQCLNVKDSPVIREGSGRRELAEWIASPDNPLTARVMVNRIWLHLFEHGLVATPDNFGTSGQKPSHPALLDYLAVLFVEKGWSVKKLIREIVLSHTYQLSAAYDVKNYAADPDNIYHWRMSQRRLDAESIRDAMLAVSGRLDLNPPAGSPVANFEGPVQGLMRLGGLQPDPVCRSVYLPIVRDIVPDALALFDFAEPSLIVGEREDTTVPAQALYMMNSPSVLNLAESMADRLFAKGLRRVEAGAAAFELTFARPLTAKELQATEQFFKQFDAAENKRMGNERLTRSSLVAFCQALLGSAEFRFLN